VVTFENLVTIGLYTAVLYGIGRAALDAAGRKRAGHGREQVK
jgi:hypothetical protein